MDITYIEGMIIGVRNGCKSRVFSHYLEIGCMSIYIWKELYYWCIWIEILEQKTYNWLKTSWTIIIGWKDSECYKLENHLLDVRNLIFRKITTCSP
jgi:hypothetical protein